MLAIVWNVGLQSRFWVEKEGLDHCKPDSVAVEGYPADPHI